MPPLSRDVPVRPSRSPQGGTDRERHLVVVYEDLRRIARSLMRFEASEHTLTATGLVHEAWLRMHTLDPQRIADPEQVRNWFLGMATRVIRQVLVDHARARDCRKRGGDLHRVPLDEGIAAAPEARLNRDEEILLVHEALERLARIDPFQAEVAELRLFGGLTLEQVAMVTDRPLRQVRARWQLARSWLGGQVRREGNAFGRSRAE